MLLPILPRFRVSDRKFVIEHGSCENQHWGTWPTWGLFDSWTIVNGTTDQISYLSEGFNSRTVPIMMYLAKHHFQLFHLI